MRFPFFGLRDCLKKAATKSQHFDIQIVYLYIVSHNKPILK